MYDETNLSLDGLGMGEDGPELLDEDGQVDLGGRGHELGACLDVLVLEGEVGPEGRELRIQHDLFMHESRDSSPKQLEARA